jgi:predicted AAA+ superfamily ATPase
LLYDSSTTTNRIGRPAKQGQPEAMKLLSWNCRGLGKPSAVRALKKLLQSHKPDIVFLTETKLQTSEIHKSLKTTGDMFPNSCIVDCTISNSNRSGGLAML